MVIARLTRTGRGRSAAVLGTSVLAAGALAAPAASAAPVTGPAAVAAAAAAPGIAAADPAAVTLRAPQIGSGFVDPVRVTSPLDGSRRLLVVERAGRIRIVDQATGTIAGEPFLDLRGQVADSRGPALALNPTWASSPYAFLSYQGVDGRLHVVRYRPFGGDPSRSLDPASATHLLSVPGGIVGDITFGSDGLLYIGTGEGSGSAPANLRSLHGKILRVNPACGTYAYCIPASNPFAKSTSGQRREIWLWGLQSPQRLARDAYNTDLWIGDYGSTTSEVTMRRQFGTGANLGWRCYEGNVKVGFQCDPSAIYAFPRISQTKSPRRAGGEHTVAGVVYRGPQAALRGTYVYYVAGEIQYGDVPDTYDAFYLHDPAGPLNNKTAKPDVLPGVTALGEGDGRELYAVTEQGTLHRIEGTP